MTTNAGSDDVRRGDAGASYRQILLSSTVVAVASIASILVGLVRTKAAAILVGPAGVGVIGIYSNLAGTIATISGLGIGTTGTRQVAQAVADDRSEAIGAARRSLFWGTLSLATIGAAATYLLRAPIAGWVLGDRARSRDVGWLSLGVFFLVVASSQRALLNGLRRTADLAWQRVIGAVFSAIVGVSVLLFWMKLGFVAFVIVEPLAAFAVAFFLVARLRLPKPPWASMAALVGQWKAMVGAGIAFMVAGLALPVAQLVIRADVQRYLGASGLGNLQAAWAISVTYVGLVLTPMGTDFYPRLAGIIQDRAAVNRLVNQQIDVALTISAPIFTVLLGFAPWIVRLLYSGRFVDAVELLRWHIVADVLKVMSWPLGYLLMAAGNGRLYLIAEAGAALVFAVGTLVLLPSLGLIAPGLAFLAMYVFLGALVYGLARRNTGFRFDRRNALLAGSLFPTTILLHAIGTRWPLVGAALGAIATLAYGLHALQHLSQAANLSGPIAGIAARLRRFGPS